MNLGIIGAGHAGVAAAHEAIKYGAEVTLFSEENSLPYYRPRITSVAFSQVNENEVFMYPEGWYFDNKIKLCLGTKIVSINTTENVLTSESGKSYKFDKVIIAAGAKPIIPSFAEELIQYGKVTPLWTIQDALAIRKKVSSSKNVAIVGGGTIGIESALRAVDAGLNVTIIEKAPRLMIHNLTPNASATLSNILKGKGIKVILDSAILEIQNLKNGVEIKTASEKIYADIVIVSIGGIPNTKIAGLPKPNLGIGIEVDFKTMTKLPNLFAAGDAALFKNIKPICSALKANQQGKVAGYNAVRNKNFAEYKPAVIALDVKFKDFELHVMGCAEEDENTKEEILESTTSTYRSIIKSNNDILGIHMVGSGKDFITYEKQFKEEY